MISDNKNQNDIINSELLKSYEIEYSFSDKPVKRLKIKPEVENLIPLLVHRALVLQLLEVYVITQEGH